jgi:glycogen debranching enzyme
MTDDKNNAKKLLKSNRINNYTIPSHNLYPHQWSWDSPWIMYGYTALEEFENAENEIFSLFNYQWNNGLVPSIVFHNMDNNTYFPGPDIWELKDTANHLTTKFNCTGIVQPPIHADACLKLYKKSKNIIFLKKIYPKLLKWHKYLYRERDIHDEGLVYIRHPWESGMDNSPNWDDSLNRIEINEFKYSKLRTDNKKVNSDERPTDITYERYLYLIQLFKECRFDEKLIFQNSEYIIQDVLFNTLLLKSNYALLEIAGILHYDNDINLLKYWINKTKISFENKFFNNDFYYNYDLKTDILIKNKTISGLCSIIICEKTDILVNILKSNFLDLENNNYSISSLDRYHKMFDSINYWRGPMWTNLSWLIISGLYKINENELADKIRSTCIDKIKKIGYYEYFDANDTENNLTAGCGDNSFSWTAAMFICLITNMKM